MTQFIAHRGLSATFPENTHIAFNAAWAAGCDGIELDIQVTRDGNVAVIHDADTARVAPQQPACVIKNTDWQDLQHIDVGQGGKGGSHRFCEQIPLLSDVIGRMPSGKLIQIEIKQSIDNMAAVIAALSQLRADIVVQVISFDADKLLSVRQALPHLDCLLVVDEETPTVADPIAFALQHGLSGLDMHYPLISDDFAEQMQTNNLLTACWTVNEAAAAKSMIDKGVTFITSDYGRVTG